MEETKLYAFVEIGHEEDGGAYPKAPVVFFKSREEGIKYLHQKYLDTRAKVDAESVELMADYFEYDGNYYVEARNGLYEGFLKEAKIG